MKNKNYLPVGKVPKSNGKIIERRKIDTPTHIYKKLLSWYRHFNKKWHG
jgi:hypothetical protein